jgi:predicted DNA-binding protein
MEMKWTKPFLLIKALSWEEALLWTMECLRMITTINLSLNLTNRINLTPEVTSRTTASNSIKEEVVADLEATTEKLVEVAKIVVVTVEAVAINSRDKASVTTSRQ